MDLINEKTNQTNKKLSFVHKTNSILSFLGEPPLSDSEISNLSLEALIRFTGTMEFRLEDLKNKPVAELDSSHQLENFFCIKNTIKRFANFAKRSIDDDVWEHLTNDHLIEVYEIESGIQVFANEKFKEINRYTPREILSHSYQELYHRRNDIEAKLYGEIRKAVQAGKTIPMNVPKHIIEEKKKRNPIRFTMDFKYISPLKDFYGCPQEVVVISSVKILQENEGVYQI